MNKPVLIGHNDKVGLRLVYVHFPMRRFGQWLQASASQSVLSLPEVMHCHVPTSLTYGGLRGPAFILIPHTQLKLRILILVFHWQLDHHPIEYSRLLQ